MKELINAMSEVNDLNRSHGVTQRGGKKYTEVFVRVEAFRKAFGTDLGIDTNIIVDDGQRVVVQAKVIDKTGAIIGSGIAEEIRGSSNVNRTSAIENGETSAIGRALSSLGLHGGSYASSFEIDVAQHNDQAITENDIKQQWQDYVNGCKTMIDTATNMRELYRVNDSLPDEAMDTLKHQFPDLFKELTEYYDNKEKQVQ
tara:strand:- start:21 stop:620 length:600 start_codon:yes stop_codon:yes gene_type:complete